MSRAHGLVDYDDGYGLPVHHDPAAKAGGALTRVSTCGR
jgi:hypothetical protein